jgi:uncharacterized membrane protein YqjE
MPDQQEQEEPKAGLFDSVKSLLATLVSIVHTRIELISTELREEAQRIESLLVKTLAALFFLGVGVILTAFAIIVAFWENYRLAAAVVLAAGFLVTGGMLWLSLRASIRERPRSLDATLGELERDEQELRSRS